MTPLTLSLLGFAVLAGSWLNLVLDRNSLTLPMLAVATGIGLGMITDYDQFVFTHPELLQGVVTFVLIVAVMGAGLAIDRPFRLRRWASTWRLLGIAMPLCVVAIAAAAAGILHVPIGIALLLGGILAPTDPVLARAIQVGPPGTGEEGEIRFALTSEAGLNDGLAFPFVLLGLSVIGHEEGAPWRGLIGEWVLEELCWRVIVAAVIGVALAWLLIATNRLLPEHRRLSATDDGFVSLGLSVLAYGLSEFADGYGLVAVFATAATLRNLGRKPEFERRLHDTTVQAERVSMVLVLVAFGSEIAGGLLAPLTWADGVFATILFLVIRPACCMAALAGSTLPFGERVAAGLLGLRGLGSFFYMGYAVLHGLPDGWGARLWSIVGLVVLISVIVHGATAGLVLRRLAPQCNRMFDQG